MSRPNVWSLSQLLHPLHLIHFHHLLLSTSTSYLRMVYHHHHISWNTFDTLLHSSCFFSQIDLTCVQVTEDSHILKLLGDVRDQSSLGTDLMISFIFNLILSYLISYLSLLFFFLVT